MPGEISFLLNQILTIRAGGDPFTEKLTRTKLLVKGINVDLYDASSPDDPLTLKKVKHAARDFGIVLFDREGQPIDSPPEGEKT